MPNNQQYPPNPNYPPPQQFGSNPQYPPPQQQQYPPQATIQVQMPNMTMGFGQPGFIQTAMTEYDNPFYATIGGRKAFKSIHGKYLMSEEGSLYAHHHLHEHGGKGFFQVEPYGSGSLSLRTHHGKHVAVDSFKNIYLTQSFHDHDCKFHLEHHNGLVSFRSAHHTYLAIDYYGTVYVSHHHKDDCLFEIRQD